MNAFGAKILGMWKTVSVLFLYIERGEREERIAEEASEHFNGGSGK